MVLEAEFEDPTSTLSSGEDIPTLLAQGIFSPDGKLTLRSQPVEEGTVDGCSTVGAWSYSVTGSKEDTVTLRLRTEGAEHPDAALYQDGHWIPCGGRAGRQLSGLPGPGPGGRSCCWTRESRPCWPPPCAAGGLALLLALLLIRRRRRRAPATAHQQEDLSQPVG